MALGTPQGTLGADARTLLQKAFGCRSLMIPGFISYDPARKTSRQADEDDEFPGTVEPIISDFAMNIRLIDLVSGSITVGKEVFLAIPGGPGWFGVPREGTLTTRLKITAGRLWSDMHSAQKEF